jgi:hypothetical protein
MCLFFLSIFGLDVFFFSLSMLTRVFFLVNTKFCSFIIEFRVIKSALQSLHFNIEFAFQSLYFQYYKKKHKLNTFQITIINLLFIYTIMIRI